MANKIFISSHMFFNLAAIFINSCLYNNGDCGQSDVCGQDFQPSNPITTLSGVYKTDILEYSVEEQVYGLPR